MIKLEKTEVFGWEHAIRGMRNPMNSWDKSDSCYCGDRDCTDCPMRGGAECAGCNLMGEYHLMGDFVVGNNDRLLMKKLSKAGTDHRKFMRMITVYVDITAPLYWWKEFDTYKVGTVANSCSTMHKIHEKEFCIDDFSHECFFGNHTPVGIGGSPYIPIPCTEGAAFVPMDILELIVDTLNVCREKFIETKDKRYWDQMIQLLPSSYNQKRTVMLNYEVLANIYKSRKNHKLDEWRKLCEWIEGLPYSELIVGEEKE